MGCFSSETSYSLPSWIKGPTKKIGAGVESALKQPFTPYTGDRAADLTGTQTDAMSMFRDMFGAGGEGTALPRLIDDIPGTGPAAGNIKDYMDPYLAAVLNPVLRELGVANAGRMQSLDAERNMAGAFGDTGAALAESSANQDYQQAISDATGEYASKGFNTAMGLRSDDLNRLMSNRSSTASWLKDLFNMGAAEQGTNQRQLDADWEEFLRKTNFDWDKLAKAGAITGGMQQGTASTSPSTASSILGGLSSAAAFFI